MPQPSRVRRRCSKPVQIGRRLVGRDDDLLSLLNQIIESMEEFFLRIVLADQELQVVDHQHVDAAEVLLELHRRLAADGGDEAVHELLGRHVGDRDRVAGAVRQFPGDGVHQVGLAQADAAIQEQRIEAGAGRTFGHAARAGVGKLVRLADDETFEREARIERRGEIRTRFDALVLPPGRRWPRQPMVARTGSRARQAWPPLQSVPVRCVPSRFWSRRR